MSLEATVGLMGHEGTIAELVELLSDHLILLKQLVFVLERVFV